MKQIENVLELKKLLDQVMALTPCAESAKSNLASLGNVKGVEVTYREAVKVFVAPYRYTEESQAADTVIRKDVNGFGVWYPVWEMLPGYDEIIPGVSGEYTLYSDDDPNARSNNPLEVCIAASQFITAMFIRDNILASEIKANQKEDDLDEPST